MLLHQPMSILFRQDSRPDSGRGTSPLSVLSWPNQVPTAPFAPRPQTICPQGLAGYLDSYPGAPGPQKDSNLRLGWPETLERGEEHGKKSPVRAVTLPEKQPGFCCLKQPTSLTQGQCPEVPSPFPPSPAWSVVILLLLQSSSQTQPLPPRQTHIPTQPHPYPSFKPTPAAPLPRFAFSL